MNKNQTVDAKLSQFERNKYFYGKLMTVRDFETEQSYLNEKRRLLSRLIHGTGVVCGLEVSDPAVADGKLTLELSPGVAIDCCGCAIVVGDDFSGKELEAEGTVVTGTNYVYLEYEECDKESVPVPANASACEEACCYNRVEEIFKVVVNQTPPSEVPEVPMEVIPDEGQEQDKKRFAKDYFDQYLTVCQTCADPMVLLAVIDVTANGSVSIDETAALVYNNPMLYELISSHLIDLDNPHEVDAEQAGALVSVENLSNPGGNIDLDKTNAITISTETPANADPKIIIGENHSTDKNNPHEVDAGQVGALVSVGKLSNPGGNIELRRTNAITISTETPANADPKIIIGENHSTDKNNPHEVTAEQAGALVSVDGVQNPGGDVDLVAGANITITPGAPTPTSIIIASTAGVDPATTVTSVDTSKVVGVSGKYAREDHVHDLADEVVEFGKLAAALQGQLNTVYQYLRERALKCTVGSFSEVGEKFGSETAIMLSRVSEELVDKRVYEDEDAFMSEMGGILELEHKVGDEIKESATEESFREFYGSVKYLSKALDSKDPLKVATAQDEVCFYASLLENAIRQYKDALECTVASFSEVGEKFESKTAIVLSRVSKELVDKRVYEDEDAFMKGIETILELEYRVGDEIKESATEESFKEFYGSVKYLIKALNSPDPLKVATAQDEVCFYASLLENVIRQYKGALECTVASFSEVGEKFESKTAIELSKYSQKIMDNEVYEDEDAFMNGIATMLELEYKVGDEIKESATEESFKEFYGSVKYLIKALDSPDPRKVATAQIDVCRYALLLEGYKDALECTVTSFAEVGKKFESKSAFELSEYSKKLVDAGAYEDEDEFIDGMKTIFNLEYNVAKEVEDLVTGDSFKSFFGSVEYLEKVFGSGDSLKVATVQIGVCRYALLLEVRPR